MNDISESIGAEAAQQGRPSASPLKFLQDEADKLRPIANTKEVESLREQAEELRMIADAKRTHTTGGNNLELKQCGDLLNQASALEFDRTEARKRLADLDGLLTAHDDEKTALRSLFKALRERKAARQAQVRVDAVAKEIETELQALADDRASELARTSAGAVRARIEGLPRPKFAPDTTAERRAILSAEFEQASVESENAQMVCRDAEHALSIARDTWAEARYRKAKAEYVWALSEFVPYCTELAAAARLLDLPSPRFTWTPDEDEIRPVQEAIESEALSADESD